ncbi:MAG TPA: ATP-binding cassette domain-containing protein [Jatrophihabitans sp.]|nr:ATP-binding cassette domain-containing protein [Jatrophihabitans sp.]
MTESTNGGATAVHAAQRKISAPAVEAVGLVKHFGDAAAVDGLDLTVQPGTVCALLGPNGAGKTTTLRILATLLRPDAGTARVLGHDVVRDADAVRAKIGFIGQLASVEDDLTGFENLVLLGRLLGYSRSAAKRRAAELIDAFGLADTAGRLVKTYSGGMRRRLDVAAGIIVRPDLLFLDEPTTGLDPRSRSQVWDLVRALVARGTTVLLTTQYLDEADQLADRIAVIDHGTLIADGTSRELKAATGRGTLTVTVRDPDQRVEAQRRLNTALGEAVELDTDPCVLTATVANPARVAHGLAELARADLGMTEFALGQPSLDEVFLALTGTPGADRTPNKESE